MKAKTNKKTFANKVVSLLAKNYPEVHCALDFKNPYELMVATILSAQCTDERVNKVTPALFKEFPTPDKMSKASLPRLEKVIFSTGFYKNKAKNILMNAKTLMQNHKGIVPQTMEELSALPGVGRKTANVVLGNAFNIPGIVVDTHVTRVTNRLGLTEGKDAVKLEFQLQELIDKKNWINFSHYIITHGRGLCQARSPDCDYCFLNKICPKIGVMKAKI